MIRAALCLAVALPALAQEVVAHRGGSPENSLQAIRSSMALGVRVEMDVRQTKDGALVLLHDQTVERTTNGEGRVSEMMLAQATKLRLPTLEDALKTGALPDIDFKSGSAELLVAVLRRHNLLDRATVSCENPAVIRRLRALAPALRLRLPLPSGKNGLAVLLAEFDPPIVTIEWPQFSPELVKQIHAGGRRVFLSAVGPGDRESSWRAAKANGVDYLETDHAAQALRLQR